MIVTAKLVKVKTEDGLMEICDPSLLGKEYLIDLSTKRMRSGFNITHNKQWEREMVQDSTNGGWLPTEMLEWDET